MNELWGRVVISYATYGLGQLTHALMYPVVPELADRCMLLYHVCKYDHASSCMAQGHPNVEIDHLIEFKFELKTDLPPVTRLF